MYSQRLEDIENGIDLLIQRTDNLYKLEDETKVSIEVLEMLKEGRLAVNELDMESATELYYLAVTWGHVENENKYEYFRKLNYGRLPMNFIKTAYSIIIFADREQYSNMVKKELIPSSKYDFYLDINDVQIKKNVLEFLRNFKEPSGAMIVFKDGRVANLLDYGIDLNCQKATKRTESSCQFITGISDIGETQIIKALIESKIIIYNLHQDSLRTFKEIEGKVYPQTLFKRQYKNKGVFDDEKDDQFTKNSRYIEL